MDSEGTRRHSARVANSANLADSWIRPCPCPRPFSSLDFQFYPAVRTFGSYRDYYSTQENRFDSVLLTLRPLATADFSGAVPLSEHGEHLHWPLVA